jgi:hypothetical protein
MSLRSRFDGVPTRYASVSWWFASSCTAQTDAALGEELDWRTLRLRWGVHKMLSLQKTTRKLALEDATAVLLGTSSDVLKRAGKPDFEDRYARQFTNFAYLNLCVLVMLALSRLK